MTEQRRPPGHPALTDSETKLPNRLHFDTVFGVVFAAGDRAIPVTLILLEPNGYAEWARGVDPAMVTETLHRLGGILGGMVRLTDLAARVGEGRFAVVLLDCNLAGGRLVADRMDAYLDQLREDTGLTFSMGVASYQREMTVPEHLMAAAEEALAAARGAGGDRIEFHG